jgi:hypothetical protein
MKLRHFPHVSRLAAATLIALGIASLPHPALAWTAGLPLTTPFPRLAVWWPDTYRAPIEQLTRYDWIALEPTDNADVASRVKALHPDEIVLDSTNAWEIGYDPDAPASARANARLDAASAEWLLTQVGAVLTSPVTESATTVHVSAVTAIDADGGTIPLFVAGDPVVLEGELARVVSVDAESRTLSVVRGVVKSAAAHAAGTRVAATISPWPDGLIFDLTAACPRVTVDPNVGPETWAEHNARVGAALVSDSRWDGLLVDRSGGRQAWMVGRTTARSIDPDRSNTVRSDLSSFDRACEAGLLEYQRLLRAGLGPNRLILTNLGFPNYGLLNGNNFEGFPNADPVSHPWQPTVLGSLRDSGSYFAWLDRALQPNLTTIQTYEDDAGPNPAGNGGYTNPAALPGFTPNYAKMRYGLATALLGDGFFSYEVGGNGHGSLGLLWFDEYDGAGRGRGWLGNPTGPAVRAIGGLTTTDRLSGQGAFDTAAHAASWVFDVAPGTGATAARDAAERNGTSCMRIGIERSDGIEWHIALSHEAAVTAGHDYTLTFWARSETTQTINAWVQLRRDPWTDICGLGRAELTPQWRSYTLTAPAAVSSPDSRLLFALGGCSGTVQIDDVSLREGAVDLWRRPFAGGLAIVNATGASAVVPLGGVYRRLLGDQDRGTNDGRIVTSVTLGPRSGLVVAGCDVAAAATALASARSDELSAASNARTARHRYTAASRHGSRAARARARRASTAWARAETAARAAATAMAKARTALLTAAADGGSALSHAQTAADTARFRANTAYGTGRGTPARLAHSRAHSAEAHIDRMAVAAR